MEDMDQTIQALRDRVAQLEQVPSRPVMETSVEVGLLSRKIDHLVDLIKAQKEWLDAEFLLLSDTRRKADILAEAYFRLLPERYAQDFGIGNDLPAGDGEDESTSG